MFSVGDKVKYIGDGHGNATWSPFEPDVIIDRKAIKVRWQDGTTRTGRSDPELGDEYYTSGDRLELFDGQQICVGDDVEFIEPTVVQPVEDPLSMFLPIGTIGTVVGICEDGDLRVVWSSGWSYCKRSRVRKCSPRQDVNKELDTLFSEFEVQ